jgi:hypothetical protein
MCDVLDRTQVQVGGEIRASDAVGGHTARAVDHAALHKVGHKHHAVSARGQSGVRGLGNALPISQCTRREECDLRRIEVDLCVAPPPWSGIST